MSNSFREHWLRVCVAGFSVLVIALVAAGCGGESEDEPGTITVWTLESEPDRVQAQEQIMAAFTEESGTEVKLRGIEEDQLRTLISSAAAGGTLPDAILAMPLSYVPRLADEQLSDPAAANGVVDDLGRDTFSQRALELVTDDGTADGEALAVPADAWGQMIFYRTDLFDEAGLEPPTTFEALEDAAQQLDSDDRAGIVLPTVPNDTFTQESFEAFALANGCRLLNEDDSVTLDSPECQSALDQYGRLAADYSVAGTQDVDTTRATYFAGKSAMLVWSSFLLDELAGLRKDARPTCPECKDDPEFLAHNTGVVTQLRGADATEGAQYGDETVFSIMTDAGSGADDLIKYLMSDAYIDWISIAPEGKIPVRLGTEDDPREYIDQWATLDIGVDSKKAFDAVYSQEIIDAVRGGPEQLDRWGFGDTEGGGLLVGRALGELPMTESVAEVASGDTDASEATAKAQEAYERLNSDGG